MVILQTFNAETESTSSLQSCFLVGWFLSKLLGVPICLQQLLWQAFHLKTSQKHLQFHCMLETENASDILFLTPVFCMFFQIKS